jgi:hypothetical protein
MISIFSQYTMKEPIELDATLVTSVHDICSRFILPMTFDEIATCMVESEDDEVVNLLIVSLVCLYYIYVFNL